MKTSPLAVALAAFVLSCSEAPGRLRIDASPASNALVTALASAYKAEHPRDAVIVLSSLTGDSAIAAVTSGLVDIATVTREFSDSQLRAHSVSRHEVARTGVLFAVNASIDVPSLSRAQICEIYSGTITNWRQLGGADLPIKAGIPLPAEGDGGNPLARVKCDRGFRFGAQAQMIDPPSIMADAISATPGGIGLTTAQVVAQSAGRVRALSIDGVAPTEENIGRGTYPIVRTTALLTRDNESDAVTRFVRFVQGPDGQRIIRDNSGVPVR